MQLQNIMILSILTGALLGTLLTIKISETYRQSCEGDKMRQAYLSMLTRIIYYATPETHHVFEQDIIRFNNYFTGIKESSHYFKLLNDALYKRMTEMIQLDDVIVY